MLNLSCDVAYIHGQLFQCFYLLFTISFVCFIWNYLSLLIELSWFQETKLRLCPFTDASDIIRNLLGSVATDNVWQQITWAKSPTKKSYLSNFQNIHNAIKKTCDGNIPKNTRFLFWFPCQDLPSTYKWAHQSIRSKNQSKRDQRVNFTFLI